MGKIAYINPEKCLRCKKCQASTVCPINAIFQIETNEPAIVDSGPCHGCGDCISKCPTKAITLKEA